MEPGRHDWGDIPPSWGSVLRLPSKRGATVPREAVQAMEQAMGSQGEEPEREEGWPWCLTTEGGRPRR